MSDYAARFVSGLVGNPEDRFSDVAAHMNSFQKTNDANKITPKESEKF